MVLFLIGLGLADETDITLKGLRAVQSCTKVYLESYTSILLVDDFKARMVRAAANRRSSCTRKKSPLRTARPSSWRRTIFC